MEFRRSGTADERRRKMLVDEPTAQRMLAPSTSPPTNTAKRSDAIARAYASAARDEAETRIADLVPVRPLGVVVLALLGLCAVAAVELAYTFLPDWQTVFGARGSEVLDVASRASLAAWLSSVLLGMSSLAAVLVYAIRRHKMDDYRGRYRLWLWCAAALLLASVNAVAGLHEMVELAAVKLLGRELLARGPGWAMAGVGLVGLLLGVFVLLDAWRSRVSAVAIGLVALLYAAAAYFNLFALHATTMLDVMIASSVTLVAHLSLLIALMLYARHVLLESRGLITARPKKKRTPKPKPAKKVAKEKAVKPAADDSVAAADDDAEPQLETKRVDRVFKIDPPHNKPATITSKPATPPAKSEPAKNEPAKSEPAVAKKPGPLARMIGFGKKPADTPPPAGARSNSKKDPDDDDDDEDSPSGTQRLSKAEKRRLKKLKRREAGA
jgi:hypothetical protein